MDSIYLPRNYLCFVYAIFLIIYNQGISPSFSYLDMLSERLLIAEAMLFSSITINTYFKPGSLSHFYPFSPTTHFSDHPSSLSLELKHTIFWF